MYPWESVSEIQSTKESGFMLGKRGGDAAMATTWYSQTRILCTLDRGDAKILDARPSCAF